MRGVGGIQGDLSAGSNLVDASVEYVRGGEKRKRRMLMIVIIPGEELLTKRVREPAKQSGLDSRAGT